MTGFMDATCPQCGKRFGWTGKTTDRPACPKCGHEVPAAELQAAEDEMERFRQQLLRKDDQQQQSQG